MGLTSSIGIAKNDFKESYNQFTSSVTFLSFLFFIFYMGIFIVFNNLFLNLTQLPSTLFYLLVIQAYFMGVKEFLIAKLRFEYKYKAVSIISVFIVISGIGFSIYLILGIFNEYRFYGAILGKGSLIILSGICFITYIFVKGREFINLKYWKYALILGIPIIFHSLSHIINAQFDRILINKYVDSASTGIYSFAYNIGMIVTVFLSSMNTAWVPWLYEKMALLDYKKIQLKAINYRNIFTLIYVYVLFLSPELIKMMADKSYWVGLKIIPWIFMAYFFQYMYTFEVNTEFYLKENKLIAIGTILAAGLNICLNIIFIPKYGYEAAAITTVISYFFLFLFHFLITTLILKKVIYGIKFHLVSIFYVSIITWYFINFQSQIFYRLIGIIIVTVLFILSLKSSLAKSD